MQEKISNNAILILNRLKSILNFKTDLELSDYLGVKQNTVSSWRSRGTIDWELVISKCESYDLNWLIRGQQISQNAKDLKYVQGDKNIIGALTGIPYYELLPASAGDLVAFLTDAKPTSYMNIPQIADCTAILPVFGSSMKGVVEPGDLIALKEIKSRSEFDPALPYLIITEEHRMVKYLHVDNNDDSVIWAESTNHPSIKLQVDSIKMVYAIKCVIRIF